MIGKICQNQKNRGQNFWNLENGDKNREMCNKRLKF